ncbi:unnamed protein product [Rotaria sp. Silwood2]|nr:unnamed protein product [Rotaria sp. Silwood2]CAF4154807.1 unnamed protein product [Rotaria sp. Silwood2]CAF4317532.1 unnamed protein product [Rotaria sp. Silwood2]
MAQSSKTASSEKMNEDNRKGPFVIEPKYDCPHLGDRAYVLVQSTELADGQQPPCADCDWLLSLSSKTYVESS